jgi:hypothetical protein
MEAGAFAPEHRLKHQRIDHSGCAKGACRRYFARSDDRSKVGADDPGDQDRETANAAGCSVDQDPLSRRKMRHRFEGLVRGHSRGRKRRGGSEIDGFW